MRALRASNVWLCLESDAGTIARPHQLAWFNMNRNEILIIQAILDDYALPWNGDHGVAHWARVLENGLKLAEETGANVEVVRLFALFHDSRRVNEYHDHGHGLRGAEFARELCGSLFQLPDHEFNILHQACAGHTDERTHPDITIQTCWDADRLDLGRVGIMPDPEWLCTEVAKRDEIIAWADYKASLRLIPKFVREEWGIELSTVK